MLYKKIVSNYKILLDEDLDNSKIDALSSILNDYAWSKDRLNSDIFYIKSTGKYKLGNLIYSQYLYF